MALAIPSLLVMWILNPVLFRLNPRILILLAKLQCLLPTMIFSGLLLDIDSILNLLSFVHFPSFFIFVDSFNFSAGFDSQRSL